MIDAVIAMGVLAVAVPMVFGTLAESGKLGLASQAETRSTWIVTACMDEIRASREGRSRYFTTTTTGQTFPPDGDVWALAFAADGCLIGKLRQTHYLQGIRELDGKSVRYIASMVATKAHAAPSPLLMPQVRISVEYPAATPATKRQKIDFHTLIP